MASSNEIPVQEMIELFACRTCRSPLVLPPAYTCRRGHPTCSNCYGKTAKDCYECREPLFGRNLVLEETVYKLVPPQENASWDFQEPRPLDLICLEDESAKSYLLRASESSRQEGFQRLQKILTEHFISHLNISGRTVKCPFPCDLRVTGAAIYRHFGSQHPEVYIGTMRKNQPFTIYVPHGSLSVLDDSRPVRCLYFIVVGIADKDHEDISNLNPSDILRMSQSFNLMMEHRNYIAMMSVGRLNISEGEDDNSWFLAIWITALYEFSPISYTIRYSSGSNSITFHGRPTRLSDPIDMKGGCLLVPSELLKDLEQQQLLELTVTFHLDLPFPLFISADKIQRITAKLIDL